MDKNLDFYQEKFLQYEPEILYALKKINVKDKEILISLFAFNLELSAIPSSSQNKEAKLIRYKWWQQEIEKVANEEQEYQIPLLNLFKILISKNPTILVKLIKIIIIRERDVAEKRFKDFKEIEKYIDKYLFDLLKIYFEILNKKISSAEEKVIKDILYLNKINKILISLERYSYNQHPFYTINYGTRIT